MFHFWIPNCQTTLTASRWWAVWFRAHEAKKQLPGQTVGVTRTAQPSHSHPTRMRWRRHFLCSGMTPSIIWGWILSGTLDQTDSFHPVSPMNPDEPIPPRCVAFASPPLSLLVFKIRSRAFLGWGSATISCQCSVCFLPCAEICSTFGLIPITSPLSVGPGMGAAGRRGARNGCKCWQCQANTCWEACSSQGHSLPEGDEPREGGWGWQPMPGGKSGVWLWAPWGWDRVWRASHRRQQLLESTVLAESTCVWTLTELETHRFDLGFSFGRVVFLEPKLYWHYFTNLPVLSTLLSRGDEENLQHSMPVLGKSSRQLY